MNENIATPEPFDPIAYLAAARDEAYPPIPADRLPAFIAAAEALERTAQHSIDNPDCALKDNPHLRESERLHKIATGRKSVVWECRGSRHLPFLRADGRCKCHGAKIFAYDHRAKRAIAL